DLLVAVDVERFEDHCKNSGRVRRVRQNRWLWEWKRICWLWPGEPPVTAGYFRPFSGTGPTYGLVWRNGSACRRRAATHRAGRGEVGPRVTVADHPNPRGFER